MSLPGSSEISGQITWQLIFIVFIVAFGTNFQIYSTSVVNNPQSIVQNWLNETYSSRYDIGLTDYELNVFWAMIVACVPIGAVLGAALTGHVADKLGRKWGLIVCSLTTLIGAFMLGIAKLAGAFELIVFGRLIIGVAMGLGFGLSGIFLTEIPAVQFRGACATAQQLFVGFADFLGLVLTLPQLLGTETLWPIAFAFPAIPALIQLAVLPFFPESPRYAFINKNNSTAARHSIDIYQGTQAVDKTLMELENERQSLKLNTLKFKDLFFQYRYRQPLIIAAIVVLAVQFSGINAVMAYSANIFLEAGLSYSVTQSSTIGLACVSFIVPLGVIFVMDRAGRKMLLLIGLSGCLVCLIALSFFIRIIAEYPTYTWASYGAIVSLIGYKCFFGIGSPVQWFIVCELFNQAARSGATAINAVVLWLASVVVTLGYLPFQQAVGVSLSFLPFILVLILTIGYLALNLPETKGKCIQEITEIFERQGSETVAFVQNTRGDLIIA